MTTKTKGLTERQNAVIATMTMRLTRQESLGYLEGVGYPMSESTLGRIKAYLKSQSTTQRQIYRIAKSELPEQHLTRIRNCELIEKLMWENYHLETNHYRKVMILKEIKEVQPYLSSYYDATRGIMEMQQNGRGQKDRGLPERGTEPEQQPATKQAWDI